MSPGLPLEQIPAAALVLDVEDLSIRDANAEALEIFGWDRMSVVGGLLTRLVAQPTPLLEAFAARERRPIILEGQRSNGVPFIIEARVREIPGPSRRTALCLLREHDHEAVRSAARHFFDAAFTRAPIGMALYNTDGEFVRVNPAFCTMLGRTELSLIGTRDQLLTHHDDRERDVEAAWRILRGELDTYEADKRFVRRDGSILWVSANLTFLRDEQRRPVAWLGQFQDIGERHGREAEVRALVTAAG